MVGTWQSRQNILLFLIKLSHFKFLMRVRSEHWEVLLSSCEENPQLITNRFSGFEGRAKGNALWQNIAIKLNSMGFGEKTVDGWRKVSIKNLLIITLCQVPTSSFQWYIQAKPK